MFPIVAIIGAISAAVSVYKGADWVAEKVASAHDAASADGKTNTASKTDTKASPFGQALAAQAAGQAVPAGQIGPSAGSAAPTVIQTTHGTDYNALARIQAGVAAYDHIGEHRSTHASPVTVGDPASAVISPAS
jgi:hypothetical protein